MCPRPVILLLLCLQLVVLQATVPVQAQTFYTRGWNTSTKAVFTLDLMHTSQLFGRIAPVTINGSNIGTECTMAEVARNAGYCSDAGGQASGGLPRLASWLNTQRTNYAATPNWATNAARPILIDAGNIFFGSPLFNAKISSWLNNKFTPYPSLITSIGIDLLGMGLYEIIVNAQTTAIWDDAMPPNIPIVVSNINTTGDEFLSMPRPGVTYQSGANGKYESWYVMNVSINGNPLTTVPVGFVGCIQEDANSAGATGIGATIFVDPEPSIRIAIQRMLLAHPSLNVIVMMSSCHPNVNEQLARNIIEIDVIIQSYPELYSNTETAGVVSKYPKIISNNIQMNCLIVSSASYGARVGHLAVQFDSNGKPIQWIGDSYPLLNNIIPDPARNATVIGLMQEVAAFETQVIGSSVHDIEGDDCRYNECAVGDFAGDALLWYCKDCVVAFQNGGGFGATSGLFTSYKGGTVSIADLYRLARFSNTLSTFYITGNVLIQVLQVGLAKQSIMQVAGMRYAYNPDPNTPQDKRISDVEVWSPFFKKYVPLVLTQSYKVASSDFLALGGGGHIELLNNAKQLDRFGPILRQVYASYIQAFSPVNGTTKAALVPCNNDTYLLDVQNGKTIWPNEGCRIIKSSGQADFSTKCVTNTDITFAQEIYPGMIAGMTVINSTMSACSGLGICSQRLCTCGVATEGLYAGLQMIRGDDCSDVRREYKFSMGGTVIFYILSAFVILLSLATSSFYFIYRSHRIVRASSPWFMHISCVGTALAAISVILSLANPTNGLCAAQYWTLAIGFGLTFGSLFAKTYRLYKIFNQREIKLISITNWNVLSIVMGVVVIELIILIAFQVTSPLQLTGMVMDNEVSWGYRVTCSSTHGSSYAVALVLFNCSLLAIGTWLSWGLRHIDGTFNETKYLGMAIYNTTLVTAIVLPLVYVFASTYPTFVTAFRSIFILYCATFVLLVITIPKYLVIQHKTQHKKSHGKTSHTMKSSQEQGGTPGGQGGSAPVSQISGLPRIRFGDIFSRQQIMLEIMSDLPTHKKLARLKKHINNVTHHMQELSRLEIQLNEQLLNQSSSSTNTQPSTPDEIPQVVASGPGPTHHSSNAISPHGKPRALMTTDISRGAHSSVSMEPSAIHRLDSPSNHQDIALEMTNTNDRVSTTSHPQPEHQFRHPRKSYI